MKEDYVPKITTFCLSSFSAIKHLGYEPWVESIGLPPLSRERLGGGKKKEEKEKHREVKHL